MNTYYISLIVLCATIYIIWQDPNVPEYINLRIKLLHIDFIRWRMARKMRKELKSDMKTLEKWIKENGKDKM
jgi:hypothetical protein